MATHEIYFTPNELGDYWTNEQVEEAKEIVSAEDTTSEDQKAVFDYWESIKNDENVSAEEKMTAMAACQEFGSIERRGDWLGTVENYDKVYVKLQELYPRPDVIHGSEEIDTQVPKITPNGDVVETVIIASEDGNDKIKITYVNGKRESFRAIHKEADGGTEDVRKTYESDGKTEKTNTVKTTSPDGFEVTTSTRFNDGKIESEYTKREDAEGNYLSTEKKYNQDDGTLQSETIKDGDKNGNYTSETYDGDGDLQISQQHSVDEDGSTTDTYKSYKPDGSVYNEKIVKRNPDGSVISIEDKDGDGNTISSYEAPLDDLGNPDPNSSPSPPPPSEPPPPPRGGDPLVLDLGGDGIITTGLDAEIHFDHDGDGFKELSGFVNSDDGLLVLDRNEDGNISDGNELFGDSTRLIDGSIAQHGFAALSEFDDQKDGKIDKNDAIFEKLRIFQDFNQNGTADEGELFSLDEKKIASLNLTYEDSTFVDKFGNIHRQLGTYLTESGEERTMTDVVFALDRTYTTTEILEVIDLRGTGQSNGKSSSNAASVSNLLISEKAK